MLPSITAQPKKPLSKEQQNFNKLNKKIEKLQRKAKEEREQMEAFLRYYAGEIYPLEQQMASHYIEMVYLLHGFLKKVTATQSKTLRQVLSGLLSRLFSEYEHEPDEAMKEIFREISGLSYEEARQEAFREEMARMQAVYRNMGYKVDLNDIQPDDSPEELRRKMAQKRDKIDQQREAKEAKKATKKKTPKQLQLEAEEQQKEDLKKKNLSTIYRQLVKAIHPDLEQDETIRKEKEAIMAQLTTAYQQNDLPTLLRLEMQWLQRDANHLSALEDERLRLYNQILMEQVHALESERSAIYYDPRFAPLRSFDHPLHGVSMDALARQKYEMTLKTKDIAYTIKKLKTSDAAAEIKEIISTYKAALKNASDSYYDE